MADPNTPIAKCFAERTELRAQKNQLESLLAHQSGKISQQQKEISKLQKHQTYLEDHTIKQQTKEIIQKGLEISHLTRMNERLQAQMNLQSASGGAHAQHRVELEERISEQELIIKRQKYGLIVLGGIIIGMGAYLVYKHYIAKQDREEENNDPPERVM